MAQVDEHALTEARRFYAEEIRFAAPVGRDEVVEAFARVPRERFLGPPPWKLGAMDGRYREVPGSDPRSTYHNVVFAIDEGRRLNNGQPGFLGRLIDASGAAAGHHVVHVGCGTGYYSAVLAELVGETGRVTAIELDEALAARARRNLEPWPNVALKQADGTLYDPGAADAILVNAGATHPAPVWLDRLLPGAKLILPLTVNAQVHGAGWVLEVRALRNGLAARFISPVGIYHCTGARDDALARRLGDAYARGDPAREAVRSLRRDEHAEGPDCWLHTDDFCLSAMKLG
jgi:protein-L-isoaspartate(D-aspartate) O-methyltransferase